MPTDSAPMALIADDGELTEVRSVLRDVDVEFAERRSTETAGADLPKSLLVSTPQYAMTLERLRQQLAPSRGPSIWSSPASSPARCRAHWSVRAATSWWRSPWIRRPCAF